MRLSSPFEYDVILTFFRAYEKLVYFIRSRSPKTAVIPGLYLIAFVDLVPVATEKVNRIRSNIIWNRWKSTLKERSIRVNLHQGTEMLILCTVYHIIGDLTPTGYSFYHSPRQTRGGGVGILIKDGFHISRNAISTHQFQTFEFMDMQIKTSSSRGVCIVIIYRRPLSSNHDCTTDHFMVEFGSLLEQYVYYGFI